MLTYTKNGETTVLDFDRYYICHEYDGGEDYVGFTIPLGHPQAMDLAPRMQLTETATGEKYRIHALDQGAQTINVKARLDTQELQSVLVTTTLSSVTPASAVNTIKPTGWTPRPSPDSALNAGLRRPSGRPPRSWRSGSFPESARP